MTLTLYSRWASLLVVLVFFSPLILLAIRIMFVSRRDKNQNNWEVTTARLTGKKIHTLKLLLEMVLREFLRGIQISKLNMLWMVRNI